MSWATRQSELSNSAKRVGQLGKVSCPIWEDELAGMAADSADGMTLIIRIMNEQIDRLSERNDLEAL